MQVGRSFLAESRSKQELLWTRVPFEFLVSLMKYFKTDTEGSLWTILLKFEIKKNKQKTNRTDKLKNPSLGRGDGGKVLPFKLGLEVREAVRKPRVSGRACIGEHA